MILVLGGTVVLLGVALVATPGPGLLVMLAGLGLLGIEFAWARRLLERARSAVRRRRRGPPPEDGDGEPGATI